MNRDNKRMLMTGLSGVVASAIDVSSLMVLIEGVRLPIGIAAFLASALGAVCNFVMTRRWAFADRAPIRPRHVAVYAVVACSTALLVALLVEWLVSGAGVAYLVAKPIAAISVFLLWSYPAQSRWVFTNGSRPACGDRVLMPAPGEAPGRTEKRSFAGGGV